jgi:hypothetical protein
VIPQFTVQILADLNSAICTPRNSREAAQECSLRRKPWADVIDYV